MALTDQDIGRIAHLARLELSADESKRMLTRLNGFFGTVEAMCAVGHPGDPQDLPENFRGERPNGRKPLSDIVFQGTLDVDAGEGDDCPRTGPPPCPWRTAVEAQRLRHSTLAG